VNSGVQLNYIYLGTEGCKPEKLRFELRGKDSEVTFLGFIVGKDSHKFNFETEVVHKSPESKARIGVQAALYDRSRVNFRGNLAIAKNAVGSDTYLGHHTLLLSDNARTHTLPALEIEADDVKAGHAATVGKVNADDMYYLNCRGIGKKMAEQLLIIGFFEKQLSLVEDVDLRNSLRQAIIKSLPF